MRKFIPVLALITGVLQGNAQSPSTFSADAWVDSVFRTLSPDEKIAQLMVVRLSGIDAVTKLPVFYDAQVDSAVRQYNVGGICLFQGDPLSAADRINHYQGIARTPVLFCIDAENGLGMRLDSVAALPRQMMLGAVGDPGLIYRYGRLVGWQCRRLGIQVDYAPVADINNNPDNPVINDRSLGEDKV
jgi:beta-N-acetylhexosaminidase